MGFVDIASILIDQGTSLHVRNHSGELSSDLAKIGGYGEIVAMIQSAIAHGTRVAHGTLV